METVNFNSIGLRTSDLQRAIRFYCEALGGEVTRQRAEPDHRAWIKLGGITLEVLQVEPWPLLSAEQQRAIPVIGFSLAAADLKQMAARVEEAGVPHHGPVLKMAGESVGMYLSDPDGTGLSFSSGSGYPSAGLPRRDPNWVPSPYAW
jgi:catechol-2,3-dioxygenase